VVTSAAHLGEVPARPEIARAPFGIRLEAAGGEHDGSSRKLNHVAVVARTHAFDPVAVEQEIDRAGRIADLDAALPGGFREHVDEAGAAADRFHGEPTPEFEPALDLESLPAVDRYEAYALLLHPVEGIEAPGDEQFDEIGVGAMLRHPRHVVEELVGR